MAVIKRFVGGDCEGYTFYCPGCEGRHAYYTKHPTLHWSFNGNEEAPSFTPSLLIRHRDPDKPGEFNERCHLFVTNGELRYCGDCTHPLAGKTVPMVSLSLHED